MQNNVPRLEKIITDLLKSNIKEIKKTDLENKIMLDCMISKPSTIKWYIQICINFKWIKYKRSNSGEIMFEITYKLDEGELF